MIKEYVFKYDNTTVLLWRVFFMILGRFSFEIEDRPRLYRIVFYTRSIEMPLLWYVYPSDERVERYQLYMPDNTGTLWYYSNFKQSIQLEKYALQLYKYNAIVLCKFRTGNHFLPVETGRCEGIDISERTCALCENVNEIADEYHYILMCPFFLWTKENISEKNITILGQIHWNFNS